MKPLWLAQIVILILIPGFFSGCQPNISHSPEPTPPPAQIRRSIAPPPVIKPSPPLVSWADYERAAAYYTTGRRQEAEALLADISKTELTDKQRQHLNFLSGVNAYRLGRHKEVENHLAGENKVPKSLVGYATYFRGQALFKDGDYVKARAILGDHLQLYQNSPFASRARLTQADSLYYQGQPQEALKEHQALLKSAHAGSALLAMGHIHEDLGQTTKAREAYFNAMGKSNTRDVRAEAAVKYKELLSPAVDETGQEDLKLDMVNLLRQEWRLDEALAMIDKLETSGGSDNFMRTLSGQKASLLFYSGRLDKAIGYYQGSKNPYAMWMYARCLEGLGRGKEAAQAYLAAAAAYGSKGKAHDARFQAGLIYLKLDEKKKADEAWRNLSKRFASNVLFYEGLYHHRKGEWAKAAEKFQTLLKKRSDSDLSYQAKYWSAVSLQKAGQKDKALAYYRELAVSRKAPYYQLLSKQRLGLIGRDDQWADLTAFSKLLSENHPEQSKPIPPLRSHEVVTAGKAAWAYSDPGLSLGNLWTERKLIVQLEPVPSASDAFNQDIERLKDLTESGTLDLAYEEVEGLQYLLKNKPPPDAAAVSNLELRLFAFSSAYLAETENYDDFVRLQYKYFKPLVKGRPDEDKVKAQRRFHPLAYPDAVLKAAREFNLHPALILAVMRIESYYQPDILSSANAQGLMQVLPSTAQKISSRMGSPPPSMEALFEPEQNIRLGAWYLAALIKEFDGQVPLAIASYNGGPFNVKRWVAQAGKCTIEEFIETIPFVQTRKYVKKVLSTFYYYRSLFTEEASGPNLDQPLRATFLNEINF